MAIMCAASIVLYAIHIINLFLSLPAMAVILVFESEVLGVIVWIGFPMLLHLIASYFTVNSMKLWLCWLPIQLLLDYSILSYRFAGIDWGMIHYIAFVAMMQSPQVLGCLLNIAVQHIKSRKQTAPAE